MVTVAKVSTFGEIVCDASNIMLQAEDDLTDALTMKGSNNFASIGFPMENYGVFHLD
jgi:hypothetical protein